MNSSQNWFDDLYLKYSKKMVSIARHMGLSQEEAEDIMQDAFLLFVSNVDRLRNEHDNPGGFLIVTLKNLVKTNLRHKSVMHFVPYEEAGETATTDTYFESLIEHLPAELSEEDKLLLVARYEEQVSYAVLSKRLGISESQCAMKIFYAKKRLRKVLEKKFFSTYVK